MARQESARPSSMVKERRERAIQFDYWSSRIGIGLGVFAFISILIGGYCSRYQGTDGLPWYYFGLLMLPALFLLEYRRTSNIGTRIRRALKSPSESSLSDLVVMLERLPEDALSGRHTLSAAERRIRDALVEVYRAYMDQTVLVSGETWEAFEKTMLEHKIIK